jgi:hypothetical protein
VVFNRAVNYFTPMKLTGTTLAALAGVVTLATPLAVPRVRAIGENDNPYQIIWERNPFQLKPVPVAPPPETKPPEPPSNITLTGITSYFGPLQAYMVVKGADGKEVPKTFREGEKIDAIEVISIDKLDGAVRVRNAGVESVLKFDTKKIPVGAAPAPVAAVPPPALPGAATFGRPPTPGGIGQPAFQNLPTGIGQPASPTGEPARTIPTRSVRVPPAPPGASVNPQMVAPQASLTPAQTQAQQMAETRAVEQQAIMMQLNELIRQRDPNSGPMPPMPTP